MRNPKHPGWPAGGERTELRDVADRWKWAYVDWCQQQHRRAMLGTSRPRRLREATVAYLEHRQNTVSPGTWLNDQTVMRHLVMLFGDAQVHSVHPQDAIDRLLRTGLSPTTLATYSAGMAAFWKWLDIPYPGVKLPQTQRPDVKVWTDKEVQNLREHAGDLRVPVDVGLFMGLRQGEIFGLHPSDVKGWTVRVQRQAGGKPLKGKRARTTVILPGWEYGADFTVPPLSINQQAYQFTQMLERAGMDEPGVRWHSLRHTYARMFLERKPDMRLLQASLGHASVTTTEKAYNWLLPDKAAALAMEAIHGQ